MCVGRNVGHSLTIMSLSIFFLQPNSHKISSCAGSYVQLNVEETLTYKRKKSSVSLSVSKHSIPVFHSFSNAILKIIKPVICSYILSIQVL